MRHLQHLVVLGQLWACTAPGPTRPTPRTEEAADPRTVAAIPVAQARTWFAEARALCAADDGRTWGVSLCGPMMLVDPKTRAVVASQADARGRLREQGGVFVGALDTRDNAANTSVVWSGVRWIQVLWPLPEDPARRAILIMHESFHRIAEQLPIGHGDAADNVHLDTLDGRYYLQLEWRALAAALRAGSDGARRAATAEALAFRQARRAACPGSGPAEDDLELHEGLAEYTGVVVGLADAAARVDAALRDLADGSQAPSFVRSFAYATGPALGLLLDHEAPGWRGAIAGTRSLSGALAAALAALAVPLPTPERAAAAYGGAALRDAEQLRAAERASAIRRHLERLVDGPVATLRFVHMRIAFDPRAVQSIGAAGTVYPVLRVVDDWGVLEVTGGALIKPDGSAVVVPAPAPPTIAGGRIAGDGWTLILAPGWTLEPDARPGDLVLARAGR